MFRRSRYFYLRGFHGNQCASGERRAFLRLPFADPKSSLSASRVALDCWAVAKAPAPFAAAHAEFIESAVSIVVGTRDAALRPRGMRAMGAKVTAGGRSVALYLPEACAGPTLANLRDNQQIAVTWARPSDNQAIQLKGRSTSIRPATEQERARVERYVAAFIEKLVAIGEPEAPLRRVRFWPAIVVEIDVVGAFAQTPGPGAGAPLGS